MNTRIGAVILAVICVGLGIGLFATKKKADDQKARDNDTIFALSNKWVSTSDELADQRNVNVQLTGDLSNRVARIFALSNQLSTTSTTLAKTDSELKAALEQIAQETARIAALETENQELDRKATDLSTTITNLNSAIADTQKKLDAAEGDRAFLQAELKRLMAEKAELERQFNDLEVLRAQVKHLKSELAISRRLEWIRKGLFGDQKGAELMMKQTSEAVPGSAPTPANTETTKPKESGPRYNLDVEVMSDGTIKVIPAATNAPAGK